MKINNRLHLPDGIVKAVSTEKHNEPGCISATTLIKGVKEVLLMERHWDELTDDVADRIWAIWGTAVHSLLEQEGENEFSEVNMPYKVNGITVTGRIDNYDFAKGIICDYKTASINKIRVGNFSEWRLQGLIYAWLLRKNGLKAERCRFIALLKDHSKTEADRDRRYPQNPVYVYEFPVTLTDIIKIDRFIRNKVDEYVHCQKLADDAIPACSKEERWEKAPKYAVMKTGRKSAVRLLDNQSDADRMADEKGKGHFVEAVEFVIFRTIYPSTILKNNFLLIYF
jgi:hypothetical protein